VHDADPDDPDGEETFPYMLRGLRGALLDAVIVRDLDGGSKVVNRFEDGPRLFA
jgi:hypothetical protein